MEKQNIGIENMTLEQALTVESESAEMASKHLLKQTSLFDFWENIKSMASKRADEILLHGALESAEQRGEL